MIDLLLRGGTVVDGTGAAPQHSDVAVSGGRIVAVGRPTGESARRVLDIDGAVVSPGFIDLHSHTDYTIFGAPGAPTQATQGVTTLVTGNCGFSPFPVTAEHAGELRTSGDFLDDGLTWTWSTAQQYADAVDALPLGVNIALQVGHNALRIGAMGAAERAPTADDIATMRRLLQQSAPHVVGFSTGLVYAPGMYADIDEVAALVEVAAEHRLLYSTHMRNEGSALIDAIDEALTVARRTGVRLEISHLKAAGEPNWGLVTEALALIEAARRDGVAVGADQYPYSASSTTLTSFLPGWALDGGPDELVRRLNDPEQSERIAAELSLAPDRIVIADTPADGPYHRFVGQSLASVASELGLDPVRAALELLRGQRGRLGIVSHSMAEHDVRTAMRDPDVAVASDSHTPGCPGRGTPHPRGMGTFTRVLGRYVRDEGLLDLPTAVRKMTGLPASRLGWRDRGVIAPGAVADIAVFDPDTVIDNATFTEPWQLSSGVLHTFISGVAVLADAGPTGAAPGSVLRPGP